MSENPFRRAIASRKEEPEAELESPESSNIPEVKPTDKPQATKRGRGRPATGKRSDDAWIGRTYYVKRETDLDVEDELLKLKRQGIEVDKSELVDLLLAAWVKWQQGDNLEIQIFEITPRRKSDNTK